MISFSRLGKHGKLGNQLFEIASTIGIARKHGLDCVFPMWEYAKYFKGPFPQTENVEYDVQVIEPGYHYHDITVDLGKRVDLLGWFQTEKYWKHCEKEVKDIFQWHDSFVNSIRKKYHHLLKGMTIAVSVRRGDYVKNPNYHQLEPDYFINAVNKIKSYSPDELEVNVLVFTDDFDYCMSVFPDEWNYMEGLSGIEQLCLGTLCDYFVIANSSFSWWMAYLGEKPSSYIIAPEFWNSGPLLKQSDDRDVVPARWEKYNPEFAYPDKIDLSDVLFTIPVKYDHQDRKENLDLTIRFLKSHFKTNISVSEMDSYPAFDYVRSEDVSYHFYKMEKSFERTRMLNDMAMNTNCPIVVNWDCDVFMDPKQILKAVEMIRSGEASGVYPYDGRFLRCNREKYYDRFRKTLSCEIFKGNHFPTYNFTIPSFGGAVIWNREDFILGGMENQFMVHYGPEDFERYERFTKLGFVVKRVEGPLFHIDHDTAANGSDGHEYFKANEKEFERIKAMSKEHLEAYVSTWPWTKQETSDVSKKELDIIKGFGITKVYVLNLPRRKDRLFYVLDVLAELNIRRRQVFNAVDGKAQGLTHPDNRITPGMIGCYESHKAILKDALNKGYETILVLEDDILPVAGIEDLLYKAMPLIPEDWEFAYLGCTEYGGPADCKKKVNDFWVVPRCAWGTQAYMIRGREPIRKILEMIDKPQERQIDEELANHVLPESGLKYYAITPSAFGQNFDEFTSDIQVTSKKMDI